MDSSTKLIWNPDEIRIPPHTLVAICGTANSGKTTFAQKAFNDEQIICSDSVLENFANQLVQITEKDLQLTPNSEHWEEISNHLGRIAYLKTQDALLSMVFQSSQENSITVFDSVHYNFPDRLGTLLRYSNFFENIYLIVINPPLEEIKSRQLKIVSPNLKAMGFKFPDERDILNQYYILKNQLTSKQVSIGVSKVFVLEDPNNFKIGFI